MQKQFFFCLLFFVSFVATSLGQVVINEIDCDQTGTDAAEFVELYNTSGSSVSLSGYSLVFFNGAVANNTSYLTVSLSGSIPAGGYIIVGNSGVTGVDFTFGGNTFQNGADGVGLYSSGSFPNGTAATSTNLVDAIVYGTSDANDADLLTALSQSTQYDEDNGVSNGATTISISRIANGTGNFTAGTTPTPDAANTAPAPVLLMSFDILQKDATVLLSFSTATEINNDYFSIERSADGAAFAEIGQVKGAGTSYEPQDYTYTDARPLPGKNYYRLRQVDFDGRFSYSPVVTATIGKSGGLSLAPVPTLNSLRVQLDEPSSEEGVWHVLDAAGRLAQSGVFPAEKTDYQLNVAALPEGAYVFRLTQGQKVTVQQFRKIR
jgi:hypothetical protein